jgi:uncharacterized protein
MHPAATSMGEAATDHNLAFMKVVSLALVVTVVAVGCSPSKDLADSMKPATPPVAATTTGTTGATASTATATGSSATAGTTTTSTSGTTATGTTATGTSATTGATATSTGSTVATPPAAAPVDTSHDIADRAFQLRSLAVTKIKVNGKSIDTWVMDTDAKRGEGMMFLTDKDVRDDQGMIFRFATPQKDPNRGFYMKNTILPLDIVFIGVNHKVLNIQKGKPFDEKNLPASGVFQDVLELKQGQAAKFGIVPGTTIDIPADVKAVD